MRPVHHTTASWARCKAACDAANQRGRADYGQRWGADIVPCSSPLLPHCRGCFEPQGENPTE